MRFILFINLHYSCSEVVIYLPTPLSRLGTYWPAAESAGPNSSQLSYLSGKHTLRKSVLSLKCHSSPRQPAQWGVKDPSPSTQLKNFWKAIPTPCLPMEGQRSLFWEQQKTYNLNQTVKELLTVKEHQAFLN